mmetsp:Transcript_30829/g.95216  ORF Transcript_30829/g.95216 Transcript_30829/m.95216 type:complete len:253 (-) Transcript_30829:510-1268(-)
MSPMKLCTAAFVCWAAACTPSTKAVATADSAALVPSPVGPVGVIWKPRRARTICNVLMVSDATTAAAGFRTSPDAPSRILPRLRNPAPAAPSTLLRRRAPRAFPPPPAVDERMLAAEAFEHVSSAASSTTLASGDKAPLEERAAASTIQLGKCGRYASRFATIVSSAAISWASANCSDRSDGCVPSLWPTSPAFSSDGSLAVSSSSGTAEACRRNAAAASVSYRASRRATAAASVADAFDARSFASYSRCIA